jgi:hypothetical protein
MKERLKREYTGRLRMIVTSELNAKNKIATAIGSLADPELRYSFGVIYWSAESTTKIDRKARRMLKLHKMHYLKADIDRLSLERKEKERGFLQI